MTSTTTTPQVVWYSDREPERYPSDVGGDIQETDIWAIRFRNNVNASTITVSVYGTAQLMMEGTDSEYIERGVDAMIELDIFDGPPRDTDGDDPEWSDIQYDTSHAVSYENSADSFAEAERVAHRYYDNINDYIQWNGVTML